MKFILIIILLASCTIERDIVVWSQKLCLDKIREVYRTSGIYFDHTWTDGKIYYTERLRDTMEYKVGQCKTFLIR